MKLSLQSILEGRTTEDDDGEFGSDTSGLLPNASVGHDQESMVERDLIVVNFDLSPIVLSHVEFSPNLDGYVFYIRFIYFVSLVLLEDHWLMLCHK